MPLYTRSDLVESIIRGDDTTAQDYIISYLDELATVTQTQVTDSSSEIVTVDATNTQYLILVETIDDTSTTIITDNIDEFDFETFKGVVKFDSEEIKFNSVGYITDATTITLFECERGYNSTTPVSHYIDTTGEILYYIADFERTYWDQTITSVDATAVQAWKVLNYETVYNQATIAKGGIVYRDSNSPNYPIVNSNVLFDEFDDTYLTFDSTSEYTIYNETIDMDPIYFDIDILIPFDETSFTNIDYGYIEYEYNSQRVFAGASIDTPLTMVDSTTYIDNSIIYFFGLSKDGSEWYYNCQDSTTLEIIETTDLEVAKINPFTSYGKGIVNIFGGDSSITEVGFFQPRKAKYLRLYLTGRTFETIVILDTTSTISIENVYDYVQISKLTYEEIVQGQRIRDVSVPPTEKLTSTNVASQVSSTISASGGQNNTNWTTVASGGSTISGGSGSTLNEECRIERGTEAGTLYARIYDSENSVVIDSVTITSASNISAQMFNRNLSLADGETIGRQLQLKVSTGANISYALRYQSTRHGFQ